MNAQVAYSGAGRNRLGTRLQMTSPITPPNVPVTTPRIALTSGPAPSARATLAPATANRPMPKASGTVL